MKCMENTLQKTRRFNINAVVDERSLREIYLTGFEGLVVSDWFAVCERDLGATAGLDLEMPTSAGIGIKAIVDAVQRGRLSVEKLDDAVRRVLSVVFKTADGKKVGGFGYGLSYTEFEYSDLCIDKLEMSDVETLTVAVKVKNVGDRTGKEIIQLYVRDAETTVIRPRTWDGC